MTEAAKCQVARGDPLEREVLARLVVRCEVCAAEIPAGMGFVDASGRRVCCRSCVGLAGGCGCGAGRFGEPVARVCEF